MQRCFPKCGQDQKATLMKSFFLLLVIVTGAFGAGCKKSNKALIDEPGSLHGRWTHTAHYSSIGGPGQWLPDPNRDHWIEFSSDGRFRSNTAPFPAVSSYQVLDSMHIKLTTFPAGDSLFYLYSLHGPTLELSQYAPAMCFEGCGDLFTK